MEKIVGQIISKTTNLKYNVKWNTDKNTSWICVHHKTWQMVCTNIKTENDALNCAQRFIDNQPNLY